MTKFFKIPLINKDDHNDKKLSLVRTDYVNVMYENKKDKITNILVNNLNLEDGYSSMTTQYSIKKILKSVIEI